MIQRRRSRLHPKLRPLIVQLRAANSERQLTYDGILDKLQEQGWDPLPSRTTVFTIIREWMALSPEIREREIPFDWHHLEKARIPWEASEWVLRCRFFHKLDAAVYDLEDTGDSLDVAPRSVDPALFDILQPFTNRWATWCWRIHLAAPEIDVLYVLALAQKYVLEEQAYDLLPDKPEMEVQGWNDWLSYPPAGNPTPEVDGDHVRYGSLLLGGQASVKEKAKAFYEKLIQKGVFTPVSSEIVELDRERDQREIANIRGVSGQVNMKSASIRHELLQLEHLLQRMEFRFDPTHPLKTETSEVRKESNLSLFVQEWKPWTKRG